MNNTEYENMVMIHRANNVKREQLKATYLNRKANTMAERAKLEEKLEVYALVAISPEGITKAYHQALELEVMAARSLIDFVLFAGIKGE